MNETISMEEESQRSPVIKALRLLAHIAESNEPVALTDLSRALSLPKPTGYRLARALEKAGFVHKDPLTRRYIVGANFEDIALNALKHGASHGMRRLLMNELAEQVGARVNLVVLKAGNLSFVEWVESTAPLRVDIRSEAPMPVHCSASGKLLLAFASADLQAHFLRSAPFTTYTGNTITGAEALARELAAIRERGYSEDDEELLPGVNCLAVPVRNRSGFVIAGLAVMAPKASLGPEELRGHLPGILDCAARISEEIGFPAEEAEEEEENKTEPSAAPGRGARKGRAQRSARPPGPN